MKDTTTDQTDAPVPVRPDVQAPAPTKTGTGVMGALPYGAALQKKEDGSGSDGAAARPVAESGLGGMAGSMPYAGRIQQSFGSHDVSGVKAHTAPEANQALGSQAYTMGDHVAFKGTPDLHTAAHEAAHVVQQQGGVSLKGGVGEAGDAHEKHADAVADRVVAGKPAGDLLDQYQGSGATSGVQMSQDNTMPTSMGDDVDAAGNQANRINDPQKQKFSKVTETQADGSKKTLALQRVYTIQGTQCLVFLPPTGLIPPIDLETESRMPSSESQVCEAPKAREYEAEVFVFFHGIKADYSQEKGQTTGSAAKTNPAKQADMARSVCASGKNIIAILPQGRNIDGGARAQALDAGGIGFEALVKGVLDGVGADLSPAEQGSAPAAVKASRISLAGHSGGGLSLEAAVGQSGAFSDQLTNITLMDAGYYQFTQLRKWLFEGKDGKTLQILWNAGEGTHQGSRQGTQTPFSFASLKTTAEASQMTAEKTTSAADGEQRMAGGSVQEVTEIKKDGKVHATVTLIHVNREFGTKDREKYKGATIGHEATRDDFMTAAMGDGGASFGAVQKDKTYLVTSTDCRLRDKDANWAPLSSKPPIAKGTRVKVINGPELKKYVELGPAEGGSSLGWTAASNLGPDLGEGADKGLATIKYGSGFMQTDGDSQLGADILDKMTRFSRYLLDNKAASEVKFNTGARSRARAHRWSTKRGIKTSATVRDNVRSLVNTDGTEGTDEDGNFWGESDWTDAQIIAQADVVVTDFAGNNAAAEGYEKGSIERKPNTDGPNITNHLEGKAIDASVAVSDNSKFLAAVPRFGLKRPLLNIGEPWHYESNS